MRDLEILDHEFPGMSFCKLGNSHGKVLLKDDEFFVVTSFNWLSFLGDPKRTFRSEWGLRVNAPTLVKECWETMSDQFKK